MEKTDILIIGAGVVGLAISFELSKSYKNIVVLEKLDSFGQETSSRNSEVLHAGMYYQAASLKAGLCVKGRRLLYDFCAKHNIPHKKTGKIIVATEPAESPSLDKLLQLGRVNGVEGLHLIAREGINALQPQVYGIAGLYSPETGIIDSHRYMSCLVSLASQRGVLFAYNCQFLQASKEGSGYRVVVRNGADEINLTAKVVINSSGLNSDIVAKNSGFDLDKNQYNLHYCKGQYFRLNNAKAKDLKMLVYPVPKPSSGGLGVHVTVDLAGSVRLGPDDEYCKGHVQDYSVDPSRRYKFYDSARKFIPFISEDDLCADIAGIRPKLQESGGNFRDFVISDGRDNGLAGFINLIGIESPGLTASLAIAHYVKDIVSRYF